MLINWQEVAKAMKIMRAISNKTRVKILQLLTTRKALSVGMITKALRARQSGVSRHLGRLLGANLVTCERRGKSHREIWYSVNNVELVKLTLFIQQLIK